ncbi:16S rRNA (guanine(527)-N(7))-methyltransferase RsmG [Elioraea sp. Yellowstone]|uniref:16S rRNA (guanine(527)-N(7))-methyltransferase RsmG n=1 Tax=Elioraea sp. Yellowstone TaxID=2592070 RepID=UPI0011511D95|nr:RsmG family class I SAM-dependent methyltransferase [Elioraea sp. Yellowstone]TQF83878.1 16S rRNA (guanine(527)-N(7))-methyltransferase RsmG [Elioraea sp. Yellowstone]
MKRELPALTADQRTRLKAYAALIARWSPRINLVAPGDLPRLWERHIADAAQLVPLIPPGSRSIADLGSGAGLPGLVLAILTGLPTHLVERDRRKAAFLREAIRAAAAPATVHAADAATLSPLHADLVTARALAPLPALLPLVARHLAPGGAALLPKGVAADAELTAAAPLWTMRIERFPSRTDPAATILRLTEVARARRSP